MLLMERVEGAVRISARVAVWDAHASAGVMTLGARLSKVLSGAGFHRLEEAMGVSGLDAEERRTSSAVRIATCWLDSISTP